MGEDRGAIGPDDSGYAGQEHCTPWFLRLYDPLVLGFFARVVWRCPTRRLVAHYARHVGRRHLDIGPGTGYFLKHARLPTGVHITLVDASGKGCRPWWHRHRAASDGGDRGRFETQHVEVVGSVAVFGTAGPRRLP